MTSARPTGHSSEHRGRRPTAQAIALGRSLLVVEGHGRVEAARQPQAAREVQAAAQAVTGQTWPPPVSWPREKGSRQSSSPGCGG